MLHKPVPRSGFNQLLLKLDDLLEAELLAVPTYLVQLRPVLSEQLSLHFAAGPLSRAQLANRLLGLRAQVLMALGNLGRAGHALLRSEGLGLLVSRNIQFVPVCQGLRRFGLHGGRWQRTGNKVEVGANEGFPSHQLCGSSERKVWLVVKYL